MSGRDLYVSRMRLKQYRWELGSLLGDEDRYRDVYYGILRRDFQMSDEQIDREYGQWGAFCGGGRELNMAVSAAANAVQEAAQHTGAEVPAFFAGPWPGTEFNASSRATDFGNVVYVDTPLLFAVRGFAQQITSCLAEALDGVTDGPAWRRARDELAEMWAQQGAGSDVRGLFPIRVFRDPDLEQIRRDMIWGALCYIAAHEAGHLARCRPWRGGWSPDNREFQVCALIDADGRLRPPQSEYEVTNAFNSEFGADMIGCSVLRHEEFFRDAGEPRKRSFILGAMSVPQIQAAAWWRRAAGTDERLGWTHPGWDLRHELVRSVLSRPTGVDSNSSENPEELRQEQARKPTELEAATLVGGDWAERLLDIPETREKALKRGLGNRGLNPLALFFLQAAYGSGAGGGSDIVAEMQGLPVLSEPSD